MGSPSVAIDGVGKRYRLGERRGSYLTLRESIASALWRKSAAPLPNELWALRDVTLEITEGEVVGLVGRNGAGKTTLLKLIARITRPTEGVVRTRGKVGALLEVGTGFHPELTGRENVYLNGSVIGMSRRDIRSRFDDIVSFAAVERFLDTPLKRYSTGMRLRLAFAVAAHLEPHIVVVDEVLAVGDAEFQRKCLGKMSELRDQGRTVLFVSHDLGAINRLCERAVWLDDGGVEADGPTTQVIEGYLRSGMAREAVSGLRSSATGPVEVESLAVVDVFGRPLDAPRRDKPFSLRLRFRLRERVPGLDLGIYLLNAQGVWVVNDAWSDTEPSRDADGPGDYEARVQLPCMLSSGDYVVGLWIGTEYETFVDQEAIRFRLWPTPDDRQEWVDRPRAVHPRLEWCVAARAPDPES